MLKAKYMKLLQMSIFHGRPLPPIDAHPGPRNIKKDPEDDKFIRCASAANAKFIISGDRHLLALKEYQEIKILSPADFIKEI